MDAPGSRDSRFSLGYGMSMLSGEAPAELYGHGPGVSLGRPGPSLQQHCAPRQLKADMCYEVPTSQGLGLDACAVPDVQDDSYSGLQAKKSPPSNGKKTKGRVKIKMEYIENKLRRYTTFSKRKTGIMKKAYELSTLTGTQVMLLVASETGHVYTFATRKLQPMITSEAGKALIQTCLNSPDPPASSSGGDQRMSATGFEETELTYNISDEDSKVRQLVYGGGGGGGMQQAGGGGYLQHHHHHHHQHAHHEHHMQGSPQHYSPSPLPPPPPGYPQGPNPHMGHPQR